MAGGYVKKKKEPYDQKTAVLTPEEQAMREENLLARPHYGGAGLDQLCSAISLNAVVDYRKLMKRLVLMEQAPKTPKLLKKNDEGKTELDILREEVAECEDFFDSEIFVRSTGLSGKKEAIPIILKLPPQTLRTLKGELNNK